MSENEKNSDEYYDIVINIDSFNNLKHENKGWEIEMTEKGLDNYSKYAKPEENKGKEKIKLNRIGILGIGGVGKSFILRKIINKEISNNNYVPTKGISVIYPQEEGKFFVCLDSQGSEEPIIDLSDSNEMSSLTEKERKKKVKEFALDKKFTEIFIQDFIIKKSNIFIVVVDQLSFSEQKLINRLKREDFETLFIIHNTQYLIDIDSIEKHINNTVKKSVFSNLKKKTFIDLDIDKKKIETEKSKKHDIYYFIEKNIGGKNADDNKQQQIIHLFMGKEGTEAGNFYNDVTINFLRKQIQVATKKKEFDVLEEIKNFLSLMSIKYMINKNNKNDINNDNNNNNNDNNTRPLNINDICITDSNSDNKTIKLVENKDFILKDCIIDEMGYSKFSENTITPAYVCYFGEYIQYETDESEKKVKKDKKDKKDKKEKKIKDKWKALIIKAEMFVDPNNIKIDTQISDDKKNCFIIVSCPKRTNQNDDIEVIEQIGGSMKGGEIKIVIECNLEKIKFEDLENFVVKVPNKGIVMIYIKVSDIINNQEKIKTEKVDNKNSSERKNK